GPGAQPEPLPPSCGRLPRQSAPRSCGGPRRGASGTGGPGAAQHARGAWRHGGRRLHRRLAGPDFQPLLHRKVTLAPATCGFALAEPIPGPTTETLGRLAKELGKVIVGSVFERRAAGIYHNTAVVLDADGSLRGIYRKMHIPDDPLYYEKYYFTPGDTGFRAFDTRFGRIGVLVCWDQWYPEGARLTALQGARI